MTISPDNHDGTSSTWQALLEEKMSRRSLFKRVIAASAATSVALAGFETAAAAPQGAAPSAARLRPPFTPIKRSTADDLILPRGYRYNVVRIYGDMVAAGQPFGYNADHIGYFAIDALEGGRSSTDGLLTVNHEYPNALLQHGNLSGPKTAEQISIERTSLGLSVFRVQRRSDGSWSFADDALNRRVTGYTPCQLTGPVSGTAAVLGATEVAGSVGNCSGGETPWSTVLTCEENVDDFGTPATPGGFGYGWDDSYKKEHQGWVTEVDPFNPTATPRKHTRHGPLPPRECRATHQPERQSRRRTWAMTSRTRASISSSPTAPTIPPTASPTCG